MEIFQIVGIALVSTILVFVIREYRPELAIQLSVVVGILIFLFVVDRVRDVLAAITELAVRADINLTFMQILLRIIGIAYIAQFGAQVCRDAGEGSTATKIEFAAKIIILALAIPIITAVLESIMQFMP